MRNLLKDKRGQIRMIEAFFASVLILSCLALIPTVQIPNYSPNGTLSSIAANTLLSLDNDGSLANLVNTRDWAMLRSILRSAIPPAFWFNLTVFDSNMRPINDVQITNGSPVSANVEVANYVCANTNAAYAIYFLRLQLSVVS